MDFKLELVPIPVTDVDRAKAFYVDAPASTPTTTTGSTTTCASCSSPRPARPARSPSARAHRGRARLGQGHADGGRRRRGGPRELAAGGVEVSDVDRQPWGDFVYFADPDGNGWALQQLPDRGQ